MGSAFILITSWASKRHFAEVTQRLNADVANHLIEEKFKNASPFLEDGSVNKPLFGDIMHDMMAVNRSIEVYLLDDSANILYSVVLDHAPGTPVQKIDLQPITQFIKTKGKSHLLGDDPRNSGEKKIFSVASFGEGDKSGYIYIILAGKEFDSVTDQLFTGFFMQLTLGAFILTMVFAALIGLLSVWFLTRNLREIIQKVKRFQEGDHETRIENAENKDLSTLALAFNEMADTIVQNLEEIKTVDALRRELIANISHDLRTPLAILQGYAETLEMKNEELTGKERENYLRIITNSSEKLTRMVTQLFEYSKLEAKQIIPQKEAFQITELASDISSKFELLAKQKKIKIVLDSDKDTPMVFADISLVERAIQNLLDNALKFTPEGGTISIVISTKNTLVQIMIKDTGLGIPEHEQSFIFERFRQAKSENESQGAGLGLAIVKKILEIHDSTISVISKPDRGTSFLFHLPVYMAS